jgi:hypothetical protein
MKGFSSKFTREDIRLLARGDYQGVRVQPTDRGDRAALVAESGRLRSLKKWTPRLNDLDINVRKGANEMIA